MFNNIRTYFSVHTFSEMRTPNKRGRREDHRTRRDRIQRRVDAFNQQMPALVDAYLIWSLNRAKEGVKSFFEVHRHSDPPSDPNSGTWNVRVVDTYCELFLFALFMLLANSSNRR